VADIGLAFDNREGILVAAADMPDKAVPGGHNLAGVDVPVGAGLGKVDILSTVVVDMAATDTVCYDVYLHWEEGTACSAQEVYTVVGVRKDLDSRSGRGHFVLEHTVVEAHSAEDWGSV